MTIIKRRANFAELIAQAAAQKRANAHKEDDVYQLVQAVHRAAISDSGSEESSMRTTEEERSSSRRSGDLKSMNFQQSAQVQANKYQISYYAYKLVESLPFRVFRLIIITLAFILLGFDTDKSMRKNDAKKALDGVVDVFFIVIGIMKFVALHFRNSLIQHAKLKMSFAGILRNSGFLNITISICSLVFVSYPAVGGWFRLLRVCILTMVELNQIPQIDVLMSGMILGTRSLASTWLLLSLVFLLYSTICVTLYRHSDPFHFGSVPIAMWTFFELSTFDNWNIVLNINLYGCDAFPSFYNMDFSSYSTNSTSFYLNGKMFLPVCLHSKESPVAAPIIFTTFILICGFILISLTVAAVTGGINDRLKCIEEEGLARALEGTASSSNKITIVQDQDMLFAMLKNVWTHQESIPAQSSVLDKGISALGHGLKSMTSFRKPTNSGKNFQPKVYDAAILEKQRKEKKEKRLSFFGKLSGGHISAPSPRTSKKKGISTTKLETPLEYRENESFDEESNNDFGDDDVGIVYYLFDKRFLGLYMRDLTHGPLYNFTLMILVCCAAVLEVWSVQINEELPVMEVFQIVFQILFTLDIICRFLSHYPSYNDYFEYNWNKFDCVLVLLTWIPIFTAGNSIFGLIRVLRILRVLRLLNDIADLNIILQAIGSSALGLFYVTALMLLFFYIFAVAGVFLFSKNDYFHFGSLGRAFLCLYQVSTLDDWGGIARTNMYGCDNYGYDTGHEGFDAYCENPEGLGYFAALYFGVFIVFGVYVLISLFVGIIITSMELLRDSIKEEDEVWEKVRENQEEYSWKDSMVENLLEIFNSMDIEENGKLTLNELKPILQIVHVTEADQFSLFMKVDKDSSGQIDFAEFLELVHLIGIAYRDIINQKKAIVPSAKVRLYGKRSKSFHSKYESGAAKYSGYGTVAPEPAHISPGKTSLHSAGPLVEEIDEDEPEEEKGEQNPGVNRGDSELSLFSTGTIEVIATGPIKDYNNGGEEDSLGL